MLRYFFVIATKKVSTVILSVSEGSPYGERFEKLDVSLTLNMTGKPDRSARFAWPRSDIF